MRIFSIFLLLCCLRVAYAQEYFTGTIVYSAEATGEKEGAKMFNEYQAREIISSWSEIGFEQTEETEMNAGKVIWEFDQKTGIYCNSSESKTVKASVQSMDDLDEDVKAFMPQFFEYELKETSETQTIAGYKSKKYEVVKSGMIKPNAKAFVWIAPDLMLRPTRVKFETEWKVILTAMPLQLGFKEGAVMKLMVSEPSMFGDGNVDITYEVKAVKAGYWPDKFLEDPYNY